MLTCMVAAMLLSTAFNYYLDLSKIRHERVVKLCSFGFLIFAYLAIAFEFKVMDRKGSIEALIERQCLLQQNAH
jgi:hypothetical protein